MSNVPNSLPESLAELATLLRAAYALGFAAAVENAEISESDGWHRVAPFIDWTMAEKKLAEIMANTVVAPCDHSKRLAAVPCLKCGRYLENA